MTSQDLEAIHTAISENHPGPVDPLNSQFAKWLAEGFRNAQKKAKEARSFPDYEFALRYFVNGFKDGHLGIRIELEPLSRRWPGFTIAFRNGKFIVHKVTKTNDFTALPAVGAELIDCDGIHPRDLVLKNVFPYFGNETLEADWISATPKLFVDWNTQFINRPSKCNFAVKGKNSNLSLEWKQEISKTVKEAALAAGFGEFDSFGVRRVGQGYWISVPTFSPEGDELKAMNSVIDQIKNDLKRMRAAKFIVLDVRGNTGGSSEWGERIAEALWTKEYGLSFVHDDSYVDWRVSKDNLDYLTSILEDLKRKFGENTDFVKGFSEVRDGIEVALRDGVALYRQKKNESTPVKTSSTNPVKGKVFLLTDGRCGSACLDFADIVLSLPGTLQIGTPTSADTDYMEIRRIDLPSGSSRLSVAMKVYRDRKRKANEAYLPKFRWEGDMSDTKKIESWVNQLAR